MKAVCVLKGEKVNGTVFFEQKVRESGAQKLENLLERPTYISQLWRKNFWSEVSAAVVKVLTYIKASIIKFKFSRNLSALSLIRKVMSDNLKSISGSIMYRVIRHSYELRKRNGRRFSNACIYQLLRNRHVPKCSCSKWGLQAWPKFSKVENYQRDRLTTEPSGIDSPLEVPPPPPTAIAR